MLIGCFAHKVRRCGIFCYRPYANGREDGGGIELIKGCEISRSFGKPGFIVVGWDVKAKRLRTSKINDAFRHLTLFHIS